MFLKKARSINGSNEIDELIKSKKMNAFYTYWRGKRAMPVLTFLVVLCQTTLGQWQMLRSLKINGPQDPEPLEENFLPVRYSGQDAGLAALHSRAFGNLRDTENSVLRILFFLTEFIKFKPDKVLEQRPCSASLFRSQRSFCLN
jgi:hypothetical protein